MIFWCGIGLRSCKSSPTFQMCFFVFDPLLSPVSTDKLALVKKATHHRDVFACCEVK